MKLGPALVMTPDLDVALAFYRDELGLSLSERFETQLVFELGGRALHVFACARPAPKAEHGADGASVISFEVETIGPAMAALAARGVTFLHARPPGTPMRAWPTPRFARRAASCMSWSSGGGRVREDRSEGVDGDDFRAEAA